jgi:hypothetical protein
MAQSKSVSPENEIITIMICCVSKLIMVLSESLVGLPTGPFTSEKIGRPLRFT